MADLLGFLALSLLGRASCPPGGGAGPTPGAPGPGTPVAPPWPTTPPSSLPPFPGPAWEYDEPVSPAVAQRAWALLDDLWSQGEGAYRIEMTAGHYVAYKAERMGVGLSKRGVTAWRLKSGGAVAPSPYGPPSPQPQAPPYGGPDLPPVKPPPIPPGYTPSVPSVPAPGSQTVVYTPPAPPPPQVPVNPQSAGMSLADFQQGLNTLGFGPIAVDGRFGPQTKTATKRFQAANPPLAVDGIPGPQSKSVMAARLAGPQAIPPAAPPQAFMVTSVHDVQHALNLLGFGPLGEDGITGAKTRAATKSYQQSRGLQVDGIAGWQTKASLTRDLASLGVAA